MNIHMQVVKSLLKVCVVGNNLIVIYITPPAPKPTHPPVQFVPSLSWG
jgi:hypothetical protein